MAWSDEARRESARVRHLKALLNQRMRLKRKRRRTPVEVSPRKFVPAYYANNRRPGYLTKHDESWFRDNARCFQIPGIAAGYALNGDELVAVHNNSTTTGLGDTLVQHAISQGARRLDCYDGFLSKLYGRHGFVEVRREKWNEEYRPEDWSDEYGRPDVIWMELRP